MDEASVRPARVQFALVGPELRRDLRIVAPHLVTAALHVADMELDPAGATKLEIF